MELKLKQQYEDWETCEKNHYEYCKNNFSPILSKYKHTTTVESHNTTASKRTRKGVFTPLDEKLKYAKVQMVCVHYGLYDSKSKGQRKSSTFTNSCPAHVTYSASAKLQALYISSIDLNHNHDVGPELYEKYPANRALRQANFDQKSKINDFFRVRGDNKLVLQEVRKETGRYEIPKSLQNFKSKQALKDKPGENADSAQRLLLQLQKDQNDDPQMVIEFSVEPLKKYLEFVFWQTGRMREVYDKYPEHLLCDATFCLNRCGMPLYIIMVVDGNLQSEIVALCLTKNMKKDYVQKLFEIFQNYNNNWKCTRSIMVDKDLGEISVLKELFPKADVEICLFHVLKAMKAKISSLRMTSTASLAARKHAQKLAYSFSENIFKENVECMLADEDLGNYPEFLKYMNENWISIKDMWVHAYRRQHFNLGEATNNRLESYNQKIKAICKRNAALDEFYNDMKIFCGYIENINDHEKFKAKTKTTFRGNNFENDDLRLVAHEIYEKVVPAFSDKIVQNLLKMISCDSTCTPVDNCDSLIVKIDNLPDAISNGISCSCSTFVTKEIPCTHIFTARKCLGMPIFTEEILSNRLHKSKWIDGLSFKSVTQKRMVFQNRHPSRPNKCKTSQEKYTEALPILQTLGNVLSSCGQETFRRRIKVLDKIARSWADRSDIKVLIGNKEYDPDEDTDDEIEDREENNENEQNDDFNDEEQNNDFIDDDKQSEESEPSRVNKSHEMKETDEDEKFQIIDDFNLADEEPQENEQSKGNSSHEIEKNDEDEEFRIMDDANAADEVRQESEQSKGIKSHGTPESDKDGVEFQTIDCCNANHKESEKIDQHEGSKSQEAEKIEVPGEFRDDNKEIKKSEHIYSYKNRKIVESDEDGLYQSRNEADIPTKEKHGKRDKCDVKKYKKIFNYKRKRPDINEKNQFKKMRLMKDQDKIKKTLFDIETEENTHKLDLVKINENSALTLPDVKEPLKLKIIGRPKGIFQTVIGLRRSRLSKVKNNFERSPLRVQDNRHSLTPVKIQTEEYPKYDEEIEEENIWLKIPILLTKTHRNSVLSKVYMNSEVIDAAQLVLKNQFRNVTAGLNSTFRVNVDFGKSRIPFVQNTVPNDGYFVQIYNIGQHMICAAGFYKDEEANISIYDSLKYTNIEHRISRLPQIVSLLSGQFKNTNVENLNLKFIKVTEQEEVDCGAHAVANAVSACLHAEPGCLVYNMSKNIMRKHLHDCLEKNRFTPFPTRTKNSIDIKVLHESIHNLVYCVCRQPNIGTKMIQCDRCSEWYHQTCVSRAKKNPKKGYEWLCEFVCDTKTIALS